MAKGNAKTKKNEGSKGKPAPPTSQSISNTTPEKVPSDVAEMSI